MFDEAGVNSDILIYGGVIGIDIQWNCDLDWSPKYCNPTYSFSRLDDAQAKIASGFNFRYANFYHINGTLHRDLIKAYGIRFVIHAHGRAGKFHIIPLTLNIGSGLALLGLAPTLCDIIALNLLPSRKLYHRAKFEIIAEEEEKLAARRASRLMKSADKVKHSYPGTSKAGRSGRRKGRSVFTIERIDRRHTDPEQATDR
ncbi:unnamed protein product [Echinostoma caproni]|uniref:ATP receptor n=1 Tax=Echinostoma caproni TaxID=27848 RepID=A0A183AMQ9_9TREM|nr:unnamed protein product [Echinostoma caproni]